MARPDDIRQTKRITTHPGEMLAQEFLVPLKISASALAAELGVPANRLTEMVAGRRNMTADTALRLADRFGTSPEFWMNLQMMYDLSKAVVAGRKPRKAA
ncbi:MAG: HigA family addiction module antidote protein [Hyphomicrobium sp.]|nr:HigA family addiction module antidote protein [Hyphomicrobium sp.]